MKNILFIFLVTLLFSSCFYDINDDDNERNNILISTTMPDCEFWIYRNDSTLFVHDYVLYSRPLVVYMKEETGEFRIIGQHGKYKVEETFYYRGGSYEYCVTF